VQKHGNPSPYCTPGSIEVDSIHSFHVHITTAHRGRVDVLIPTRAPCVERADTEGVSAALPANPHERAGVLGTCSAAGVRPARSNLSRARELGIQHLRRIRDIREF
jgi:hypothetical protein